MKLKDAGKEYEVFYISENKIGRTKIELTLDTLYRMIGCKMLCTFVRYIRGMAYRIFGNDNQNIGRMSVRSEPPIYGSIVIFGLDNEGELRSVDDFDELVLRGSMNYDHIKDNQSRGEFRDAIYIVAEKQKKNNELPVMIL